MNIATGEAETALFRDLLAVQPENGATRIAVSVGTVLDAGQGVYFLIDAIASVSLRLRETSLQLGFATRGDAIGLQRLFVSETPEIDACILKAGHVISVRPDLLKRLMHENAALNDRLAALAVRAMGRYLDQAASAVTLSIEQRVARWIYDYHRALGHATLPVTHQQIASALGVRRSGVTVALHVLEGERLIRSKRARIDILSSDDLRRFVEAAPFASEPDGTVGAPSDDVTTVPA